MDEKNKADETLKECKEALKLLKEEIRVLVEEKSKVSSVMSEKDSMIESLQQHVFQLKEIVDERKDDSMSKRESLGKYFCPNRNLNNSANFSFNDEQLSKLI